MNIMAKNKVLILGGGFGGIKTALELSNDPAFEVTLLSDRDTFRYYPALFRAATGGNMKAAQIPLKEIFDGKAVKIEKGTAKTLERKTRTVKTAAGKSYKYDTLVVALGVVTNFFGIKGLEKYSYGIKTQDEAKRLRNHIHKQLVEDGKPDLNYVVIGGGPTGVELAGELPAYIKHVMQKHSLPERKVHIDLVEAAPRLTPRMPKSYSQALARRLRSLGIKLYLNQAVQAETADALTVSGHDIQSHTVIWTAGVTEHPFLGANKFSQGERGKTLVDEYLQAEPNIYVIGDNADTKYGGMAQTALYDASFLAHNLKRQAAGHRPRRYRPKKPVYITPAGPFWAAVLWSRVHLYGWAGWVMRTAADYAGYHDYEPWWPAGKHWIAEFELEVTCPVCSRG